MRMPSWILAAAIIVGGASAVEAAVSFEFIHETADFPGGITADGNKAVINVASGPGAAIYTRGGATPLQPVAGLSGYQFTAGSGISGDATTVIGRSHGFGQTERAFRWTQADGPVALSDPLMPSGITYALAVSGNGSVIVGGGQYTASGDLAWRWTDAGGFQRLTGYENFDSSYATAVSSDGSVIAGTTADLQPGISISQAFRWTSAGGFELLPGAPFRTWAWGISGDGSTIIGNGEFTSGDPAFRWTQAGGFEQFEHTIEFFRAESAAAVAHDGSVVVGQGQTPRGYEAWMWDQQHGVRLLTDLATEMGIDLQGQYLESATAISADGTVVAGRSYGPLGGIGYIMVVPEPGSVGAALLLLAMGSPSRTRRRGGR